MMGGAPSLTWTTKLHVAVLPAPSTAVQFTEVVPTGNAMPEAGMHCVVAPEQLSTAFTMNVTTAVALPASVILVMFVGHVIRGASVSLTVILKLPRAALPAPSVAVQVT